MEYFRIKYVNDGAYFLIKSDTPPTPPVPTLYALYNAMDATTDTALNATTVAIPIVRGGKSPTGGRDIAVIDYSDTGFITRAGKLPTGGRDITVIDYPNIGVIDLS